MGAAMHFPLHSGHCEIFSSNYWHVAGKKIMHTNSNECDIFGMTGIVKYLVGGFDFSWPLYCFEGDLK